ncbi:fimbrial protein [Lelliottia wanjuensis]|uniref:Fimbrial protein n=1 Tax=Lelliottia wanjuensis TaxID=3050585 RepID=A0AAP4FRY1_9ENTR|nr:MULTISPECIES: fimbrial protein [unclassified Lelliottia]MDK9362346.1 fimbrial protein [Lelliottia sp. V106_12]MDK9616843.1 fimbrial protein [Lelliottia sp. V106_9]
MASPCVANNGSDTLSVDLSSLQASDLSTAGAKSTPVSFSLDFKNCPAGTTSVNAAFSGSPDPDNANYYKNAGTATGVSVALIQYGSEFYKGNGSNITQNVEADNTVSIRLEAQAISVAGKATPGTISADIVATLQYN